MNRLPAPAPAPAVVLAALLIAAGCARDRAASLQRDYDMRSLTNHRYGIAGEVADTRRVSFDDGREHLLVKVRTTEPAGSQGAVESEQTRDDAGPFDRADVVVALGPCDNLDAQQVEPAAGDWLVATGEAGRVNDRPVLVADRAQVNGREILGVDQHERFHLIEGRVMDVGDARYDPRSAPARLVRLQSPDGETRVADLGPAHTLALDIQPGDNLLVQGYAGRVNGRPVLVATSVAKLVTIDRDRDAALAAGDAPR